MNRKLIFIGGSKGVGKTSLAKVISDELNFEYINTGDKFREYRSEFDRRFCQELTNLNHNVVIDTHYAVSSSKTPYSFNIGFNKNHQKNLRINSEYEGKIILIEASPEVVFKRRKQDGDLRRCFEIKQIIKENDFNLIYSRVYAYCLDLPHHIFKNEGLSKSEAIIKLKSVIKNE